MAKFIPGLATVAAILAGSLNMRLRRFLIMDGLGVLLYVSAWTLCGFVFAPFLRDGDCATCSAWRTSRRRRCRR